MKTFNLRIYAAEHIYFTGTCEHIQIPTVDGQYGILANHSNVIAEVEPGVLTFTPEGKKEQKAVVTRGMIKVEDNDVLILVHRCEDPELVDINAVKRAEAESKRKIREKRSKKEYHMAQANLSRAFNKLKTYKNDKKF